MVCGVLEPLGEGSRELLIDIILFINNRVVKVRKNTQNELGKYFIS